MDFWNSDNFKGLADMAAQLDADADYAALADYCRLKEQGLKKPALQAAEAFAAHLDGLPVARQRIVAGRTAALDHARQDIHQLLPHPVVVAMKNVFAAWAAADMAAAEPRRWLGHLDRDRAQFEAALALDPADTVARAALADAALEDVAFQCHHLQDSSFLGAAADAEADLARAQALIAGLPRGAATDRLTARHAGLTGLIAAWAAYESAGKPGDFPAWCKTNSHGGPEGRSYFFQE